MFLVATNWRRRLAGLGPVALALFLTGRGCWQPALGQQTASSVGSATMAATGRPLVFAHRGGRKWAPENTLSAFRKSLDAKVDGIELDIHRCKTGELVVMHDEDVSRTTDGIGLIRDHSLSDLRKLSAGFWFSPEFKSERVPLLSEVLDLVGGKAIINIEIKNAPVAYPGIEDDLIKLLAGYKYPEKIQVSSFDHELLRRIHEKAPQYKLALLADGLLVDLGKYAGGVGASSWNPAFGDIRSDSVEQAHRSALAVNVWTVNNPYEWVSAVDMGVDGIITDDPRGLMQFLSERATKAKR